MEAMPPSHFSICESSYALVYSKLDYQYPVRKYSVPEAKMSVLRL